MEALRLSDGSSKQLQEINFKENHKQGQFTRDNQQKSM